MKGVHLSSEIADLELQRLDAIPFPRRRRLGALCVRPGPPALVVLDDNGRWARHLGDLVLKISEARRHHGDAPRFRFFAFRLPPRRLRQRLHRMPDRLHVLCLCVLAQLDSIQAAEKAARSLDKSNGLVGWAHRRLSCPKGPNGCAGSLPGRRRIRLFLLGSYRSIWQWMRCSTIRGRGLSCLVAAEAGRGLLRKRCRFITVGASVPVLSRGILHFFLSADKIATINRIRHGFERCRIIGFPLTPCFFAAVFFGMRRDVDFEPIVQSADGVQCLLCTHHGLALEDVGELLRDRRRRDRDALLAR
eukprot:scaffold1424_cov237-Pinguiococcus_pyrenoidosus.AAC.1